MESRYHLFFIQLVTIYFLGQFHGAAGLIGQTVQRAQPKDLPFVASLAYDNDEVPPSINHFCTGTLISDKFILTAKHCINEFNKGQCVIRIGCTSLQGCTKHYFKSWTTFETWAIIKNVSRDNQNDDLAVIELTEPVQGIASAMLYSPPNGVTPGKILYAAGWGYTDGNIIPDGLREVSLTVLEREECERRTDPYVPAGFFDWDRMICTATDQPTGYALLRPGDSGGPLFDVEYRVVGINVGVCPYDVGLYKNQVNLHNTVMFYRDFLATYYRRS